MRNRASTQYLHASTFTRYSACPLQPDPEGRLMHGIEKQNACQFTKTGSPRSRHERASGTSGAPETPFPRRKLVIGRADGRDMSLCLALVQRAWPASPRGPAMASCDAMGPLEPARWSSEDRQRLVFAHEPTVDVGAKAPVTRFGPVGSLPRKCRHEPISAARPARERRAQGSSPAGLSIRAAGQPETIQSLPLIRARSPVSVRR